MDRLVKAVLSASVKGGKWPPDAERLQKNGPFILSALTVACWTVFRTNLKPRPLASGVHQHCFQSNVKLLNEILRVRSEAENTQLSNLVDEIVEAENLSDSCHVDASSFVPRDGDSYGPAFTLWDAWREALAAGGIDPGLLRAGHKTLVALLSEELHATAESLRAGCDDGKYGGKLHALLDLERGLRQATRRLHTGERSVPEQRVLDAKGALRGMKLRQWRQARSLVRLLLDGRMLGFAFLKSSLAVLAGALSTLRYQYYGDMTNLLVDARAPAEGAGASAGAGVGARAITLASAWAVSMASMGLVEALGQWCSTQSARAFSFRLKTHLFAHLLRQDCTYFDRMAPEEAVALMHQAEGIGEELLELPTRLASTLAQVASNWWLLHRTSPELMASLGLAAPLVTWAAAQVHLTADRAGLEVRRQEVATTASHVQVLGSHLRTVKAHGGEAQESRRYQEWQESRRCQLARGEMLTGLTGHLAALLCDTVKLLGLCHATVLVRRGQLQMGDLVTCLTAADVARSDLLGLQYLLPRIQSVLLPAASIARALHMDSGGPPQWPVTVPHETEEEEEGSSRCHVTASSFSTAIAQSSNSASSLCGEPLTDAGGGTPHGVCFEEVYFTYATSPQRPVLTGLSFELSGGAMGALCGKSGCGKSTVLSLLLRLYNPGAGRILIGGEDVATMPEHYLRSLVAVVPQEPVLFPASVLHNICYGLPEPYDLAKAQAAAKEAEVFDLIMSLPGKWYANVDGLRLSGGQKQRIALARALVRDPLVLLLDEATSALDAVTETAVLAHLRARAGRCTSLLVAHRLSTLLSVQQIYFLEQGYVAEMGEAHELLHKVGGQLSSMYMSTSASCF
ncbi:hypothetical protein CYMTET_18070 [Cymbomonas tetramitiformis]|uniref:Uncharacterized protein n=1 Tax=Cymbomonas tetramitiformis TaxID=36881 RepID=A0AAE0G965_9CHLO|nr:hypothetical protein CYMTET_18070 [Cymbomonas tetramitiformis]